MSKGFTALLTALAVLLTFTACTGSGDYDKSLLVDFDCSGLLEQTTSYCVGAGDFIDDEYSRFKELYQFYEAVSEVFTDEPADRLICECSPLYIYEGAVWRYFYDGFPELIDRYETQEHHYIFLNTGNGWRCDRFDTVW